MPRFIRIPGEEVMLCNMATGKRLKRQTDAFEEGGNACIRCGETKSVILENDPPYSMIRWLEAFILTDSKLRVKTEEKNNREVNTAEGVKTLKLFSAVRKAFKGKKTGDEVILDETYWERIKEVLEKPGNIWAMDQMSQFDVFFEAWFAATDESAADRAKKAEAARKAELEAASIPVPMAGSDSGDRTAASA